MALLFLLLPYARGRQDFLLLACPTMLVGKPSTKSLLGWFFYKDWRNTLCKTVISVSTTTLGTLPTTGQSMAIFIAILGLVPLSRGFSLIVGLVLNIEGEFVPYIVGVTLMVQNFSEIFCIDFVGLFGSKCIRRIYQTSTEWIISACYLRDLDLSDVLHSLTEVIIYQYLCKSWG